MVVNMRKEDEVEMTINEWKEAFKSFVNELQMPRDDYNGIMYYIDEGAKLLKRLDEQEVVTITKGEWEEYWGPENMCPVCLTRWMAFDKHGNDITNYCPGCGRKVKQGE